MFTFRSVSIENLFFVYNYASVIECLICILFFCFFDYVCNVYVEFLYLHDSLTARVPFAIVPGELEH